MSGPILRRPQSIPVLYTRGTHFEVGLNMGRTFSGMIKEFLKFNTGLNQSLLPAYGTPDGKKLYDQSLSSVKASFPQYIRELEGIARGAEVEFYKLFLLHLGDLLPHYILMTKDGTTRSSTSTERTATATSTGCLNIVVNNYYHRYIAHTQDVIGDMLNYSYFVVAHIKSEEPQGKHKVTEEKFMALCYAGQLPGFAMASNHHGIVFTVNKLTPGVVSVGRTPPHFLGRALLSAESIEQVAVILSDEGAGAADGFSLSIASVNDRFRRCFIIEVAPAILNTTHSVLNIGEVPSGSYAYHANKYQGLDVSEISNIFVDSTPERLDAVAYYEPPRTKERLLEILNDEKVFLDDVIGNQRIRTLALGIFDLSERTLTIYITRPRESEPFFVLPMILKSDCRVFEN